MIAPSLCSIWFNPEVPRWLLTTGLVLCAPLWLTVQFVKRNDPFHDIPGPFLARWTPLWLAYQARRGLRYLAVDDLHKKYGPVVRISPNHISVADKDAISAVYAHGNGASDKSPYYDAFKGMKASVFSTRDRREHSQKRRVLSHAFSSVFLMDRIPCIQKAVESFVEKMDKLCETKDEVDVQEWFHYLTFDILGMMAFGEPMGMLAKGSDTVLVTSADGSTTEAHAITLVNQREHLSSVLGLVPSWMAPLSKFLPDPFFSVADESSKNLVGLADVKVKRRLEDPTSQGYDDVLSRLIDACEGDGKDYFTDIVCETVTLLIAGTETTANTLTAIMFLLKKHPRVYDKLLTELEKRIEGDVPEYRDVKDIPYLDAVIDEGMRCFAPMSLGLPRTVPDGGMMCCGRFYPKGTELSVPAWTIQNDPMIWGDPEVFRPERWLESEHLKSFLLAFGKGPRACLGKNLAYMELRLILSTILLRYTVDLTSKDDVLPSMEDFTHKPLGLEVRFTRRGYGSRP